MEWGRCVVELRHGNVQDSIAHFEPRRRRRTGDHGDARHGSFYTHLPESLLRDIGLTPTEVQRFELADGSVVERGIAEARAAINGRNVTTIVAFSADDVEPLLGAYTLEGLGLTVDPVNETLRPAPIPRR